MTHPLSFDPGRILTSLVLSSLAACLLLAGTAYAQTGETEWKLYDREQTRPVAFAGGPHELPCGGYGVFEMRFDAEGTQGADDGVPVLEQGREIPLDYPLLTSTPPSGFYRKSPGDGAKSLFLSRAGKPAPPPCDGGSCFTAPGEDPWVAVVDWDNWHGWSVGWTIRQASGGEVEVALLALHDPTLATYFGQRVTDVHLLAQLCQLAEILEDPGVEPPVAVNLSLGRPHRRADAEDESCNPSTLSCQIGRVLEYLRTLSAERAPRRANPTLFFAAAGNHRRLLFPGNHSRVTAVGALDLQQFHQRGRSTTAWETPEAADALFPGHGLCLEYEPAPRLAAVWTSPPGSSFATALMTGWLAPSLDSEPLPESRGRWAPAKSCRGRHCTFVATRGSRAYGKATAESQKLIQGTASDEQTACSSRDSGDETTLTRSLGRPTFLTALPSVSFPEASPSLLRPTPEPASCVPCEERANRRRNRNRNRVTTGLEESGQDSGLGVAAGATRRSGSESLTVQLWAGQPLAPDLTLRKLYLRVENLLFPVELRWRDRRRLAAGEVDLLEIDLGRYELSKRTQPSLVWVLRGPSELGRDVEFWTSTPILLRSD